MAEIRFGTRGHDGAALLRYYFPGAHVVSIHAKTATVTVSLGDKFRGVATASSVQAALKRKDITLDTTTPGQPTPSPSC